MIRGMPKTTQARSPGPHSPGSAWDKVLPTPILKPSMWGYTFNVSSDSPGNRGTLDFVAAELFIDAGAGVLNALEVSDQGDPDADAAVRITRDRIEGLAPATIHYQALGRFGRGVHVLTGTGDDQVRVESTLPADVTTLWLNKGNDRAVLSDADPGSPDGLVVVYGEDGDDTIDAASWSHGVIAFGDYGAVTYGSAEESRRSLRSAESRTTSTGGSDTLIGTDSDDLLVGGAGADSASLYGRGGNDILIGDSGKVTYSGGRVYQAQNTDFGIGGNDYLDGGEGHDILIGGAGSDTFVGNFSEDILIGEHGRVTLNSSGQATSVVRLGQRAWGNPAGRAAHALRPVRVGPRARRIVPCPLGCPAPRDRRPRTP